MDLFKAKLIDVKTGDFNNLVFQFVAKTWEFVGPKLTVGDKKLTYRHENYRDISVNSR